VLSVDVIVESSVFVVARVCVGPCTVFVMVCGVPLLVTTIIEVMTSSEGGRVVVVVTVLPLEVLT